MRFTPLATGRVDCRLTVREWIDELMLDVILAHAERPSWKLPEYEEAHAEEFITTFLRPASDF